MRWADPSAYPLPPTFSHALERVCSKTHAAQNALAIPSEQRPYEAHTWTDEELRALTVPTTAVLGANSPPFNRLFIDRLAALSASVRVQEIPDADHGLPETDPGRLVQAVL